MKVFRHPVRLFGYEFRPSTIPIPPIYHLSVAALAGHASFEKAGIRVNAIFLGLLCIALWGIGKRLGGEWAGLAAAVIFSSIAEVQALAREQVPDLALTSLVAAAYWAYLESEGFSRKLPSIIFGILFGLAQLTKWSAFSYFLPVFLFGAGALGDRRGRLGAGLALATGVALSVTWYRAHLPFLIPKLLDSAFNPASSTSVFSYLGVISRGLELPLLLTGIMALASYRKFLREQDFPTHVGWFALSLLFWSLIPARDPRFILPALAPIAVLVTGLRKKGLLWGLSIFQLLCVLNFGTGIIPKLEVEHPLLPVRIFRSMPASPNDWRIPEILREAQNSSGNGNDREYISVLGEHRFFNTATFDWERRKLGLNKIRLQWPSRNMGAFANFVVLKVLEKDVPDIITLRANPFGSTLGQVEGADGEPAQGAWFRQGYRAMQRWILPDNTRGVMFWRRQLVADPFRERYAFFDYYRDNGLIIRGMGVNLGEWDPSRGVHREVVIHARSISFDGLKAKDVHMVMEDLTLLPIGDQGTLFFESDAASSKSTEGLLLNVRFLRMRRLRILSASVRDKDAEAYLVKYARVPGLKLTGLSLKKNVEVKASLLNFIPVTAEAAAQIRPDGRGLEVKLIRTKLAGLPLPLGLLLGEHVKAKLAFDMNLPFEVEVAPFKIKDGRLFMSAK